MTKSAPKVRRASPAAYPAQAPTSPDTGSSLARSSMLLPINAITPTRRAQTGKRQLIGGGGGAPSA